MSFTVQASEFGALISAARLVVSGESGPVPPCIRAELARVLARHERHGGLNARLVPDHGEYARPGGEPTIREQSRGALTRRQRAIGELAAEGLTNDEIAASLHLSRRTVETHLTAAYRRLGIGRRAQLAAALRTAPASQKSVPRLHPRGHESSKSEPSLHTSGLAVGLWKPTMRLAGGRT